MLKALEIKNFILIDSLEIRFPAGLVIITGETGAGKSILLGAISLLTGGKADASLVGPAGDNCVVEGEFSLKDEGDIIVRRVVSSSGRSRCFVNDEPVSREVLEELASRLVDIHSQHQTLKLGDPAFRLSVLDAYAGCEDLKLKCAALYKEAGEKRRALAEAEATLGRLALEKDFNELMFNQLDSAKLRSGELEELEAEQKLLSNAEDIKLSLLKAENLFEGGEDTPSVSATLKEISRTLGKVTAYVPAAEDLATRLDSAKAELEDILAEVSDLESSVDVSQERLEAVEARMSLIYSLLTKHSVRTVEELIEKRDSLAGKLFDSGELELKRDSLKKDLAALDKELSKIAEELHNKRAASTGSFAKSIEASLAALSLENARFGIELTPVALGANGTDAVKFTFSATGGALQDMAKASSGGELSRIMLAIKDLMARYTAMPTLIFDEIDTGISGSVADKMGSMICRMGEDMQVFAITHLPQVAAKGKAHLLVTKEVNEKGRAVSHITQLNDEERLMEIARMLSGSSITPEAKANAAALLRNNQSRK